MKWAIRLLIFIWLLCGLVGAGIEGKLDRQHWKEVAKGPITLAKAVNDNPASIPGLG